MLEVLGIIRNEQLPLPTPALLFAIYLTFFTLPSQPGIPYPSMIFFIQADFSLRLHAALLNPVKSRFLPSGLQVSLSYFFRFLALFPFDCTNFEVCLQ